MHESDRPAHQSMDETSSPVSKARQGGRAEPADASAGGGFHPVLFYRLTFGIAWTAWAPLVLHVRGIVKLPIPYAVAHFVCHTLGAFPH